MKTFLICILTLALVVAAFMTRPGKREFVLYLLDRQTDGDGSWSRSAIEQADATSRSVTLKNRVLWTDVEKDGKVIYTGAFAHWFSYDMNAEKILPSSKELAKLIGR